MIEEIYQKQFPLKKILLESWKLFLANFQLIVVIALIFYFPMNLWSAFNSSPAFFSNDSAFVLRMIIGAIFPLVSIPLGLMAMISIAIVTKSKIDDKVVSFGSVIKEAYSKLSAVFFTQGLSLILTVPLFLLFIFPGIVYSIYWVFAIYPVIFNDQFGKKALNYSKQIVKGRGFKVLIYNLVFSLPIFVFAPIGIWATIYFNGGFWLQFGFATLISIFGTFVQIASVVLYVNFEATKPSEMHKGIEYNLIVMAVLLPVLAMTIFGTAMTIFIQTGIEDGYTGRIKYMKYEDVKFSSIIAFFQPLTEIQALDFSNNLGYSKEEVEFTKTGEDQITAIQLLEDLGNKKTLNLNHFRDKSEMDMFLLLYQNKLKADKASLGSEFDQKDIEVQEFLLYFENIGMSLFSGSRKSELNKESLNQYLDNIQYVYSVPINEISIDWYPNENEIKVMSEYINNYKKEVCINDAQSMECLETEGSNINRNQIVYDDIFPSN